MARNIFIVNATQVVVSDANPQGIFSTVSGFPQNFDSRNYNDDTEAALRAARSVFYGRLAQNYAGSPNRVMATVTLEQANGQLIMRDSMGAFPVIAPQPEPEPEPESEEEPTEEPTEP